MNSRLGTFLKGPGIIALMLFLLVSCQDTVPNRSTITNGNSSGSTTTCDDGFTYDEDSKTCVANAVTRPQDAVFFKDDFCICQDNKAYSAGSCVTFCSTKSTDGEARLFANFTVSADISLNTSFANVAGWCNTILESEGQNAGCEVQFKDASGNVISASVGTGTLSGNAITNLNVGALTEDTTYQMKLVQLSSGYTSDAVQVIRYSVDIASASLGILKQAPVSQYTCIVKALTEETVNGTVNVYSEAAYRLHFYYHPSSAPSAVPAGTDSLVCHDPLTYGTVDSEEYPRLELRTDVFRLWDKTDIRFYDNTSNNVMDVNDIIVQKTKNYGATIPSTTNFFSTFTWPGSPTIASDAGDSTSTTSPIGYYMAPWIDTSTGLSFCLTSTHYNSSNALYRALGDVLQADTEGLYVGEKAAETLVVNGETQTGAKDYILIRETDLKKVWFYIKNGVLTAPTDSNVANNTIYFYYPLNYTTPYVKTSSQRLYRVRSAEELSTASSSSNNQTTSTGTVQSSPPHDRKIGCIPKI